MLVDQEAALKIPKIKIEFWKVVILKTTLNSLIDESGKNFHATGSAQGGYQGMGYIGIDPDPVQLKNSFDWAAGGLQLSFLNSGEPVVNASGSILGMEFMNSGTAYSDGYRFNFLPTVSAIDMGNIWSSVVPNNINQSYVNWGSNYIMNGTWFDVISMGAPAPNPPYENLQLNDVVWSIQQNNDHNSKIRNENVTQYNESGWLLYEIGTERLNLENYLQNWSAHFVAVDQIALYAGTNPHFQYPYGPPPQKMEGTFSKKETYKINTGVIPSFELGVGGNFYDLGPYYQVYIPKYTKFDVCNQYKGYANKKAPSEQEYPVSLEIRVYPNPSTYYFEVELESEKYAQLQVVDITGRIMYTTNIDKGKLRITTKSWPKGMYLVRLTGDNESTTFKWMKI